MEELVSRGEPVRMVNRTGKMDEVPAGVEVVAADLYDPVKVKEVTQNARVVYQAAQPEYHEWEQKFAPLQAAIIDGLSGNGTKLVIVENLYGYGLTNGTPITEAMPLNPHTRKGAVRVAMHRAALAAHQDGKVRVSVGRGSDFFGPWGLQSSMGERTIYPLLQGKTADLAGRGDQPHTHTYTRDFGSALVILGERDEADGQAWNVPNDSPHITQDEMVKMLAEMAGVPVKSAYRSKNFFRFAGLFVPAAREIVEMMYEFEQPFVVDSSKFENTFGMRATPIREAMQVTVDWYKSHPQRK
jgi:nucleoside-diphosphate-sugar epimerase